jgi:lysophospholipase L1-like esterase
VIAWSDRLVYAREDLEVDGTHPSNAGRAKVADLLMTFFKTNPTTKSWFLPTDN